MYTKVFQECACVAAVEVKTTTMNKFQNWFFFSNDTKSRAMVRAVVNTRVALWSKNIIHHHRTIFCVARHHHTIHFAAVVVVVVLRIRNKYIIFAQIHTHTLTHIKVQREENDAIANFGKKPSRNFTLSTYFLLALSYA